MLCPDRPARLVAEALRRLPNGVEAQRDRTATRGAEDRPGQYVGPGARAVAFTSAAHPPSAAVAISGSSARVGAAGGAAAGAVPAPVPRL